MTDDPKITETVALLAGWYGTHAFSVEDGVQVLGGDRGARTELQAAVDAGRLVFNSQRLLEVAGATPIPAPAPQPDPRKADVLRGMPTAVVVPPVDALVSDIRTLAKQALDRLKARNGELTPMDMRTLEGLARTTEAVQRMDRAVREDLAKDLAKLTDEQLREVDQRLLTKGGK